MAGWVVQGTGGEAEEARRDLEETKNGNPALGLSLPYIPHWVKIRSTDVGIVNSLQRHAHRPRERQSETTERQPIRSRAPAPLHRQEPEDHCGVRRAAPALALAPEHTSGAMEPQLLLLWLL